MVVIRLARGGRVKQAIYRIVAADKRRAATGKFLDILGTYNPHTKETKINKELTQKYLINGAQPSDRVLRILQTQDVITPDWAKTHDRFKKSKQEAEDPKSAAAPTDGVEIPAQAEPEAADANIAEDKSEAKIQSVDAPETAATEAKVATDQKEATEKVAQAAEKAQDIQQAKPE
ncbi:MAG: 30S ribosomal protein S16 [Patescibacteria group bacterium]|nr:30S ribosomal protein S16 [Patescibacteria group bacterium]